MATSTINADYLYEVYNVNIPSYSSAGAGVRAGYVDTNIEMAGYIPVSATIGATLPGVYGRVDLGITDTTLRCLVYHTYQAAIDGFTCPVRVMYIKSGT